MDDAMFRVRRRLGWTTSTAAAAVGLSRKTWESREAAGKPLTLPMAAALLMALKGDGADPVVVHGDTDDSVVDVLVSRHFLSLEATADDSLVLMSLAIDRQNLGPVVHAQRVSAAANSTLLAAAARWLPAGLPRDLHIYRDRANLPADGTDQAQLRNTVVKTLDACQSALELAGVRCAVMPDGVCAPWENSPVAHTLLVASDEEELFKSLNGLTAAIEFLATESGRRQLEAVRQDRETSE